MGREFLDLFTEWADTYDETVQGHDKEYEEVFRGYESILETVAKSSNGTVLEFGTGTGNLSLKLLKYADQVIGVEPSPEMRAIAQKKLGKFVEIIDGDFLHFSVQEKVNTIVSTYAFHHLTDDEKLQAFDRYSNILGKGDKIVFADTMYESKETFAHAIQEAKDKGYHNLATDLEREYYTTIPFLQGALVARGFDVHFTQMNDFVWLMEATKK